MKNIILVLVGMILVGCTTSIPINTDPSGAKVYVDGEFAGPSPAIAVIPNHIKYFRVRVELDGYEPQERIIQKQTQTTTGVQSGYVYGSTGYASGIGTSSYVTEAWPDVLIKLERKR